MPKHANTARAGRASPRRGASLSLTIALVVGASASAGGGCAASPRDGHVTARDVATALEAELLAEAGAPARAVELLERLRARFSEDDFLRARHARALHASGARERAWAILGGAEASDSLVVLLTRAELALEETRYEAALGSLDAARGIAPSDRRVLALSLEVLLARGDVEAAEALVDAASSRDDPLPTAALRFRLDAALAESDAVAVARVAARLVRDQPARRRELLERARLHLAERPELALALLAPLADTLAVAGAKIAARASVNTRRRNR